MSADPPALELPFRVVDDPVATVLMILLGAVTPPTSVNGVMDLRRGRVFRRCGTTINLLHIDLPNPRGTTVWPIVRANEGR